MQLFHLSKQDRNLKTVNSDTRSLCYFGRMNLRLLLDRETLWSTVDRLLGRGGRACDRVSADELSIFFANKVKQIQSTASGAQLPSFRPVAPDVSFAEFATLSSEEVAATATRLPESSAVDPISSLGAQEHRWFIDAISDVLIQLLAGYWLFSNMSRGLFRDTILEETGSRRNEPFLLQADI